MKLYEINEALVQLDHEDLWFDPETGEVREDLEARYDALKLERKEKIENICLLIKSKLAFAQELKKEQDRVAKRRARFEREAEWLQNYLAHCMAKGEKFSSTKAEVSWRMSKYAHVEEEFKIPDAYFITKHVTSLDRAALLRELREGKEIPGAELRERQNIQIK